LLVKALHAAKIHHPFKRSVFITFMETAMFRSEFPLRRRLLGQEVFPVPRNLQRVMDSFLQDIEEPMGSIAQAFSPHIDVEESDREVRVYAELPGLQENDVEIMYEPGVLVLRGEKKEEQHGESRRGRGRWEERRYGAFERRIPLQSEVQEDQIQASFDRGVLTVVVPKSAEVRERARRIPVKAGALPEQQQSAKGRQSPSEGAAAH
jgi:HSP20 family protein